MVRKEGWWRRRWWRRIAPWAHQRLEFCFTARRSSSFLPDQNCTAANAERWRPAPEPAPVGRLSQLRSFLRARGYTAEGLSSWTCPDPSPSFGKW